MFRKERINSMTKLQTSFNSRGCVVLYNFSLSALASFTRLCFGYDITKCFKNVDKLGRIACPC